MKKLIWVLLILTLFACGKDEPVTAEINSSEVTQYLADNYEKMAIDGSTSMIPLHQSLNKLFKPDAEEDIYHSKTVEAFEKFITGENDILLGVDYSDELLEKAKNAGVDLVQLEITREAFIFLINRHNPVKSLTTDQIKDIYSGKITNWSEAGGDSERITAYQRNSDSGSQIRMDKFMGDAKLSTFDVEYLSMMGWVIEKIADYDEGRYSIAYNIYTFAEKQYINSEVTLLAVDGVYPTDDTVFDGSYPITIYNYIYYDANNAEAAEYAVNLHAYLMSDEGQQLISDSGYVNLNTKLDRNTDISAPYDYGYDYGKEVGFYDEEKGEFYDAGDDGKLYIYISYAEYVLHGTKYLENEKACEYLEMIFNSEIECAPHTVMYYGGVINLTPWFDASFDPDDFFNYEYNGKYYYEFKYYIDEDRYELTAVSQDYFDLSNTNGELDKYSDYTVNCEFDSIVEIKRSDLRNLKIRVNSGYGNPVLEYIQPFADVDFGDDPKQYVMDNYTEIAIDGSTSMLPLHESLERTFGNPEDTWVEHSKTVDAFNKLLAWKKLILLSVDFSDELMETAVAKGADIVKLPITREAFAFLINRNNPVKDLTTDQIKDIYSGKITNWSEVGGDDAPIKAYQRNSDSGSQIRMVKFMGDTELMTSAVEYVSSMGWVVEQMADYDEGRYSIAYNMYTFTEKQYVNDDVELLSVDGIHLNDDSVYDNSYPITIYNYIYYDANNTEAATFAVNLHAYLMSDEGQQLISDSGYVNLNKSYDRNMENITVPYDFNYHNRKDIGFYDEEKGEYYNTDNDNQLVITNNYTDYVLYGTEYIDNAKAREFLTMIDDSDIKLSPYTAELYAPSGTISFHPWFDASFDPEDFFNFRYGGKYYSGLTYYIDEDKFVLESVNQGTFDSYTENDNMSRFAAYLPDCVTDISIELTIADLKDLYFRSLDQMYWSDEIAEVEIEYSQMFK